MEIVSIVQQGHLWAFLVLVIGIIALPGAEMAKIKASSITYGVPLMMKTKFWRFCRQEKV